MQTSFYRKQRLLPFLMNINGYKEYQYEMIRPSGMPENAQFSICTFGEGEFTDENGKTHRVRKGDIFYFLPDTPHSYRNITEKWSLYYLIIGGERMPAFLQKLGYLRSGVLHPDRETYEEMCRIWQAVDDQHKESINMKAIARLSSLCYKTMIHLCRFLFNEPAGERERAYNRILPVLSAIDVQYGTDLTLDSLAALIGVTPTYLCRLFKNAIGISPVSYITNVRMERAKQLLRERKELPVNRIAAECGFADPGYFGRVFRRAFGITPESCRTAAMYGKEISHG